MAPSAGNGRIEGDTVARRPALHFGAHPGDHAGRLVAHHNRRAATPGTPVHPVDVTSTYPARPDGDQDFVVGRLGDRYVHIFEPARSGETRAFISAKLLMEQRILRPQRHPYSSKRTKERERDVTALEVRDGQTERDRQ